MPLPAAHVPPVSESAHAARTLLGELGGVHCNLFSHLQALEDLSSAPSVDSIALANARWKLGQASLSRGLLAGRICEFFLSRCNPDQATALKSLRDAGHELLRQSATHIGKWTAESIARDWIGYCRDDRGIRRRIRAHIAAEQSLLYPLLERLTASRGINGNGASDGTRTRDLRRDRPAL